MTAEAQGFAVPPIYVITMNPRYRQENISRPNGIRNSDELLFVLAGEGILRYGEITYDLQKGSAFYIRAGEAHAYESDGSLVTAWITFRGSMLDRLDAFIGEQRFFAYDNVEVVRYSAQIEQIQQEYCGKRRTGRLSAMMYSLLMELLEEKKYSDRAPMEQVMIYMEENYHRKITLEQLADQYHSSKSAFCREFRRTYGCTAFEKLMEIRLSMAKHMLLTNSVDKISVIAGYCGFEDAAYFCKAFRTRYGCSPGAFRELEMELQ